MPGFRKHFDYGFHAVVPYIFLLLAMHSAGLVCWRDFVAFLSFGAIALIAGSDLPDIDLRGTHINNFVLIIVTSALFRLMELGAPPNRESCDWQVARHIALAWAPTSPVSRRGAPG